jgi:hypothetical protein
MQRKIILVVDCADDKEKELVQGIANEISGTFNMKGSDLISFYPFVKKNKALLYSAVKTVARDGKKGMMKLIPMLIKQL